MLKEFLGGRCFKSNEEEKDAIKEWFSVLVAEAYDKGIHKLIRCTDKCLNVCGDCVEM